jgi:hypothetical protein
MSKDPHPMSESIEGLVSSQSQPGCAASPATSDAGPSGAWRTIDSAPRDGTPFWAYQRGREQYVCWEQDTRDGLVWMDENDNEPEPTHWMPLPAPPADAEGR